MQCLCYGVYSSCCLEWFIQQSQSARYNATQHRAKLGRLIKSTQRANFDNNNNNKLV